MAIYKGFRFPIDFDEAFGQGLIMVGEVSPDNEYQPREDRSAARQRVDEVTGKRPSFEITLLTDVQPVPTTSEVQPGMRPIELVGLTAEPKVAGQREFKYQSYLFRANGFKASKSSRTSGAAESTPKAA
ncbi:hypothetical protein ACIQUM_07000 [Amycolatopsis azurea]|uniref:hypothetical protein n=1 Tax=Amycolatopsis azurea TaxID=36819 RepID=UPI0038032F96